jgi:hypothetical protein
MLSRGERFRSPEGSIGVICECRGRRERRASMTICPIAIAVGCEKCPAFKVCPLKTVLGDQKKADAPAEKREAAAEASPK